MHWWFEYLVADQSINLIFYIDKYADEYELFTYLKQKSKTILQIKFEYNEGLVLLRESLMRLAILDNS